MSLKNLKESQLPQMPLLQILKTMNFPRALWKLQNIVYFRIFSYLKFFPVFIIYGSAILFSNHVLGLLWSE